MTKAELVDKLASEGGITKVQANKVLGALVEAVIAAMTSGEAVMLGVIGLPDRIGMAGWATDMAGWVWGGDASDGRRTGTVMRPVGTEDWERR